MPRIITHSISFSTFIIHFTLGLFLLSITMCYYDYEYDYVFMITTSPRIAMLIISSSFEDWTRGGGGCPLRKRKWKLSSVNRTLLSHPHVVYIYIYISLRNAIIHEDFCHSITIQTCTYPHVYTQRLKARLTLTHRVFRIRCCFLSSSAALLLL